MSEFVQNCKLCKKPKAYSSFYICDSCIAELNKVSTYMKNNPNPSIEDISKATSLPSQYVERIIDFFLSTNKQVKH